MKTRFCKTLGLVVLVLGVGAAAPPALHAQAQTHPIVLRLGPAFPVGNTRDSVEFSVGAELELQMKSPIPNTQLSISGDWMAITSRRGLRTRDVNLFPVLINARWFRGTGPGSQSYGAGLGATFASARIPEMDLSSDLNFGWQVFWGYHFTPRIRGDARFVASSRPGDDGVFLVQVGYRL